MENAVVYARNRDCLLVAASGNDNSHVMWPAAYSSAYDNVIAVSGTDSNDNLYGNSNTGPEINVAAPGVSVYSTMPDYQVTLNNPPYNRNQDYDTLTGTSMAAPHVSGFAALIYSCDNTLFPDEVRHIIEESAIDLGDPGWDSDFGHGRIDMHAALAVYAPCYWRGELVATPRECVVRCFTESFCFYAAESFCVYRLEHPDFCTMKSEVCNFVIQTLPPHVPCKFRTEPLPCAYPGEGPCLREAQQCLREIPSFQRERMGSLPQTQFRHIRPLTRSRRLRTRPMTQMKRRAR